MRWITDKKEFETFMLDARSCVYIDSGRYDKNLQRLQCDDTLFFAQGGPKLLKTMMEWSELEKIYFTVLDPDPEYFFHDRYGIYPCIEIEKKDIPENFRKAINTPINGDPNNVLNIAYFTYTITSPTIPWFVHAIRSFDGKGGHLWVPKGWPERIFEFDRNFIEAQDIESRAPLSRASARQE